MFNFIPSLLQIRLIFVGPGSSNFKRRQQGVLFTEALQMHGTAGICSLSIYDVMFINEGIYV